MTKKLYGHDRARDLDSYCDHLLAMTSEDLHSKADIACELAWRDEQIGILRGALEHYKGKNDSRIARQALDNVK